MKTSSAPRRGPKPDQNTRVNLVQAGLSAFHSDGYAATGIQGIVALANVPKGSFYNHFPSKEIFGSSIVDAYFERAKVRLDKVFGNTRLSPLARLAAYFDELIAQFSESGFEKGCLLGNLSAEIADHSEAIRLRLIEHFDAWSKILEDCLAQAQTQGELDTSLTAASLSRFILSAWEGALLRMRVEKNDRALVEFKLYIFGKLLSR
ncbi:TetR family transcriptional regulator C-terminal domain-containing protein [Rouxiella sp. Mn2063]|uniref:TetR/AcrR family transcriptional regulator n=1 Tax=Rouxiella sp. Mn2063 TaxID=3395262 RepID=UPI003BEA6D88